MLTKTSLIAKVFPFSPRFCKNSRVPLHACQSLLTANLHASNQVNNITFREMRIRISIISIVGQITFMSLYKVDGWLNQLFWHK